MCGSLTDAFQYGSDSRRVTILADSSAGGVRLLFKTGGAGLRMPPAVLDCLAHGLAHGLVWVTV